MDRLKRQIDEFVQRQGLADGPAVADHMQIVVPDIDDRAALRIPDPGLAEGPLRRHGPVQNRGAAGHFADLERNLLRQDGEGPAVAFAGEAAAEGKQARGEIEESGPRTSTRDGPKRA